MAERHLPVAPARASESVRDGSPAAAAAGPGSRQDSPPAMIAFVRGTPHELTGSALPIGSRRPESWTVWKQNMKRNIFVAGASGAIGRRLCRLLVNDGWSVIGTTRSPEKAPMLRDLGVEPAIVDVFNEALLLEIVRKAEPEIVVHQLTDLPPALDPTKMAEALVRNARLRDDRHTQFGRRCRRRRCETDRGSKPRLRLRAWSDALP